MSNLTLRNRTSTQIIEAYSQTEAEAEYLLEEGDLSEILRGLTGLSSSRIAAGLELADEWD